MHHLGTKQLETERLLLRKFSVEDAGAMFDNWASDPEVTKYLTWPAHGDVSVTRSVLEQWVEGYADDSFYQWAIVLKEEGTVPIGCISVVSMHEKAEKVEIGYCIGRKWWRRGITSEALRAVMDYMFSQVGVLRVEAKHDVRNTCSGAVMRKCGMQYEGTLRQYGWNNQGICDTCYYARLASDLPCVR